MSPSMDTFSGNPPQSGTSARRTATIEWWTLNDFPQMCSAQFRSSQVTRPSGHLRRHRKHSQRARFVTRHGWQPIAGR